MPDKELPLLLPLFKKIAQNNILAFENLFHLYKNELYNVALKLCKSNTASEEIVQEVFISLWISREKLLKVEQPDSYIYRILLNQVSKYLKKESNQKSIISSAKINTILFSNLTEDTLDENDCKKAIEMAIEQLPKQQFRVFKLSHYNGLTNEEIAEVLHLSPHTVKSHLTKANYFLRHYLKDIMRISAILLFFK